MQPCYPDIVALTKSPPLLRVMEYWCRTGRKNWVRDSSLEIEVLPENYGDWPIRKDLLEQTE